MAKVELKKPIVEEISANIADAQGVVLVNYSGLTVAQDTQLRKELREAGVHYKVYKEDNENETNSHIRRLTDEERVEELAHMLSGATLTEAALNNARALLGKA